MIFLLPCRLDAIFLFESRNLYRQSLCPSAHYFCYGAEAGLLKHAWSTTGQENGKNPEDKVIVHVIHTHSSSHTYMYI